METDRNFAEKRGHQESGCEGERMTDEQFVREHWERIDAHDWVNHINGDTGFLIAIEPSCEDGSIGIGMEFHEEAKPKSQAWSAAAEFTRDRLEEIRQLEEEIAMVRGDRDDMLRHINFHELEWIVECARWSRILARLESALEDLKKGMK
jgi:hypothetical protein